MSEGGHEAVEYVRIQASVVQDDALNVLIVPYQLADALEQELRYVARLHIRQVLFIDEFVGEAFRQDLVQWGAVLGPQLGIIQFIFFVLAGARIVNQHVPRQIQTVQRLVEGQIFPQRNEMSRQAIVS